ncbi:DAK2 domain-containing protein [soil metagenome]
MELEAVRRLARAALQNLEAHRQRIDDLNVYPVPYGDTGTNLALTVRSAVGALEASTAEGSAAVARELSRAALLGARGNSGVIFSQVARGFADVLSETEAPTAADLARAFRAGSDAAYRAVRNPVEGTMLTVIREMAEEGERPEHAELSPADFFRTVVVRGEDALARTPEMLDVLREAGVVDAGGAGLIEIVRGLALATAGEPLPEVSSETSPLGLEAIHLELSRYRYCTGFVVEGDGLDLNGLESSLERLGDSLLVVGDESAIKVHVHTDDPGAALSVATVMGVIGRVEIADMHAQTFEREGRLLGAPGASVATLETGVVAVCQGEGNRRLFKELGATTVIEGGQTMNPSAAEIVEAIDATPAAEVIVLPNNSNVISTAEQAIALASRPARVVPSRSVQAGFAAIVRFLSTSSPDENEAAMLDALASAVTGEVTVASRDTTLDGVSIRKGAYLGLVDGTAVTSDEDIDTVAIEVVARLLNDGRAWLGVLVGADAPPTDNLIETIRSAHPGVDVERYDGDQPHYPLLMVAE